MFFSSLTTIVLYLSLSQGSNFFNECAKYYRPKNYLDLLPNLNMPYVDHVIMPDHQNDRKNLEKVQIQPTPVVSTKVISVKTKYVYRNPVCVKYSKKKKFCKPEDAKKTQNVDKLITKEYFVQSEFEEGAKTKYFPMKVTFDTLESSQNEADRSFQKLKTKTPHLSAKQVNEMLIEDRLDQLETIVPGYTRRRKFETSTITVTKAVSNGRSMATLIVKNCVPLGFDFCPEKTKKKRKSKIAEMSEDSEENRFYFG